MIDREIEELAARVLSRARATSVTIGCAESCTGGMIASALTAVPGSSDCFVGGVVSYWEDVKRRVLRVPERVIAEHGVVSSECAMAMAHGACELLGCDIAVSTTGIAGPSGAEPGKPVGTVWYGVSAMGETRSFMTCEGRSRDEVRALAVKTALTALLDSLGD